jgi:hypothetical protein
MAVTREFIRVIGFEKRPNVCVFWVYTSGLNTGLRKCISYVQDYQVQKLHVKLPNRFR